MGTSHAPTGMRADMFSLPFIRGLGRGTKAKEGLLIVYLVYGWRSIEHALCFLLLWFLFLSKNRS